MKKKIALVIYSLSPGGAEKVIVQLANSLTNDYRVLLIVLYKTETFYEVENEIEIVYLNKNYNPSSNLFQAFTSNFSYIRNIIRILRTNSVNLVISFTTVANFLSFLSCKIINIPIIISERKNPLVNKLNFIWQCLGKITSKYSDVLVVQTEMIKNVYKNFVLNEKIKVIPNPIDLKMKSFLIEYDYNERENVILTVGRLDANKNQILLINAFANLNLGNWKLIIVGDGVLRNEYIGLTASLGIADKVEFVGNVRNVWDYYNQAKIFAFTSNSEGFPNSLLEAMSFGLPCISTDCDSGPAEIIINDESGYLIEINNRTQLEDRLSQLINNQAICNKFSQNAISTTQKFNMFEVRKLWEVEIQKLL